MVARKIENHELLGFTDTDIREWIKAVESDDLNSVRRILDETSVGGRSFLLHGQLPEWCPADCGHKTCNCYGRPSITKVIARRSMSVAVTSLAGNVFEFFVQKEVPLTGLDYGGNALHLLMCCAHTASRRKEEYLLFYKRMAKTQEATRWRELLREVGREGLNALELSAKLGLYDFFETIMNTEGLYLVREESRALCTYRWYDVTEYEDPRGSRRSQSPLHKFILTDRNDLTRRATTDFFSSPLIKTWFLCKFRGSWPIIRFWLLGFFMRMVLLYFVEHSCLTHATFFPVLYKQYVESKENTSAYHFGCFDVPSIGHHGFIVTAVVSCLVQLPISFYTLRVRYRLFRESRRPTQQHSPCLNPLNFSFNQILFEFATLAKLTMIILGRYAAIKIPIELVHLLDLLSNVNYIIYILYFLQLTRFGHSIVTLQHMVKDLVDMIVIIFVFLAGFAATFYNHLTSYGNNPSGGGPDFQNLFISFYGAIKATFHTAQFGSGIQQNQFTFIVLHTTFILLVALLLLNLVIAVFSESVSHISKYKQFILMFQQHMLTQDADLVMLSFIRGLRRKYVKRFFAHNIDKIYLIVTIYNGMCVNTLQE